MCHTFCTFFACHCTSHVHATYEPWNTLYRTYTPVVDPFDPYGSTHDLYGPLRCGCIGQPSTARLRLWMCLISRLVHWGRDREHKTTTLFFLPQFQYSLLEFNSRKICQPFTNWTRWNKRDKVWARAYSLFKWRFRCRPRRCYFKTVSRVNSIKE